MPIYVECRIRGTMDDVWRVTQTPELHERWDLRFTSIAYAPRANDAEPQRFRYSTRIGFGIEIEGWGETVGERAADGVRTSALKFGSDDWRSLIRAGSGYWKYEQVGEEVRFITAYDYEVRWGEIGRAFDRLIFRPLMGWATAWSFDRLRLWVETGLEPHQAGRQALIHGLAAAAATFVWTWQGMTAFGPVTLNVLLAVVAAIGLLSLPDRPSARRCRRAAATGEEALPFASGVADACEWFDDSTGRYQIEVAVTNRTWGPLFGYRGSFDVEWVEAANGPPSSLRPRREEGRE